MHISGNILPFSDLRLTREVEPKRWTKIREWLGCGVFFLIGPTKWWFSSKETEENVQQTFLNQFLWIFSNSHRYIIDLTARCPGVVETKYVLPAVGLLSNKTIVTWSESRFHLWTIGRPEVFKRTMCIHIHGFTSVIGFKLLNVLNAYSKYHGSFDHLWCVVKDLLGCRWLECVPHKVRRSHRLSSSLTAESGRHWHFGRGRDIHYWSGRQTDRHCMNLEIWRLSIFNAIYVNKAWQRKKIWKAVVWLHFQSGDGIGSPPFVARWFCKDSLRSRPMHWGVDLFHSLTAEFEGLIQSGNLPNPLKPNVSARL